MSHAAPSRLPRPINFLFENSIFLIAGTILALFWANLDKDSYHNFVEYSVVGTSADHDEGHHHEHKHEDGNQHTHDHDHENAAAETADTEDNTDADRGIFAELYHRIIERPDASGHNHGITLHFLINDIFMALFFFLLKIY